jgi:hypothetical protein
MADYPVRWSNVEVVFTDGTVETYRLRVGAGFGRHLAKQAGGDTVHSFPLASVRSWTLTEIAPEESNG